MTQKEYLKLKAKEDSQIRNVLVHDFASAIVTYSYEIVNRYATELNTAHIRGESSETAAQFIVRNLNGRIHTFKQQMREIIAAIKALYSFDPTIVTAEEFEEFMGDQDETLDLAQVDLLTKINAQIIPSDYLSEVTARVAREVWSIVDDIKT